MVLISSSLETEKISSMARIVRGVAVLQVKAASWSGSQTLKVSLPGGYPELTFKDASGQMLRYFPLASSF